MPKPILYADFNEMLESNLVLLSATDEKISLYGEVVSLHDGLEVMLYMDDVNEEGRPDNLMATGVVEANRSEGWGAHVKWCCRIDERGIVHQSDL